MLLIAGQNEKRHVLHLTGTKSIKIQLLKIKSLLPSSSLALETTWDDFNRDVTIFAKECRILSTHGIEKLQHDQWRIKVCAQVYSPHVGYHKNDWQGWVILFHGWATTMGGNRTSTALAFAFQCQRQVKAIDFLYQSSSRFGISDCGSRKDARAMGYSDGIQPWVFVTQS